MLAVYVLIASVTIVLPVAASLIMGDRVDEPLTIAKKWLIDNNTVMSVLFVVLGFTLIGDALTVLL